MSANKTSYRQDEPSDFAPESCILGIIRVSGNFTKTTPISPIGSQFLPDSGTVYAIAKNCRYGSPRTRRELRRDLCLPLLPRISHRPLDGGILVTIDLRRMRKGVSLIVARASVS